MHDKWKFTEEKWQESTCSLFIIEADVLADVLVGFADEVVGFATSSKQQQHKHNDQQHCNSVTLQKNSTRKIYYNEQY